MSLLKNQNFLILFLSTIISGIGTGITLIGISWIIIQEYESSRIIASLTVASHLITFLFIPKFSTLVDKISRKQIALSLFLVGGVIQFFVGAILLRYGVVLYIIFISAVVSSLIRTCDQVNRLALSKQLFPEKDYPILNAYLEFARQAITFLAGGGATFIFRHAGLTAIILCDAATYLIGFVLIKFIVDKKEKFKTTGLEKNVHGTKSNSLILDFKETFSYLLRDKNLFFYYLLTLIPYIVVVSQNVIYPAHFHKFLKTGSEAFAFLAVPYGLGAVLAALVDAQCKKYMSSHSLICTCFILYVISVPLVIWIPNVYITFGCLFIFAMAHATIRIERMTFLMREISDKQMGRVTGFFELISLLFNIILAVLAGYAADNFGVGYAWLIFEAVMLTALVGIFLVGSKAQLKVDK